jgi:hypothetical protein
LLVWVLAVLLSGLAGSGAANSDLVTRASADRFVDVTWLDGQHGFALVSTACGSGSRCAGVYGTRTGGKRWSRLTQADSFGCARASRCVSALRFITPRIGYLYGPASFMTTDGGRTWIPSGGPQVESIAFSGGSIFRLAYRGTGCPGPCEVALQRSRQGTRLWTTVGHFPNAPGFGEQIFAGGANLYVIFYGHIAGGQTSAHAAIDFSHDRGRTWSARRDPCGGSGVHEADAVAAAATGRLFSILCVPRSGGARAFTTLSRDAGRRFSAGTRIQMSGASQVAVEADADIAVGNAGITGGGSFAYKLALSGDGGRAWRVAIRDREALAQNLEAGSLQFVGARGVSWVGSPYFVQRSVDDGHTWRKILAP